MGGLSIVVRRARIFERRNKLFMSATLEAVDGIMFDEDDAVVVEGRDEETAEMALRAVLSRSRSGLPHPGIDYKTPKFNQIAGVSGNAAFVKGAKCVLVALNDGVITLRPLRNEGARLGFYDIEGSVITHQVNAPRLGEAIYTAVDRAIKN